MATLKCVVSFSHFNKLTETNIITFYASFGPVTLSCLISIFGSSTQLVCFVLSHICQSLFNLLHLPILRCQSFSSAFLLNLLLGFNFPWSIPVVSRRSIDVKRSTQYGKVYLANVLVRLMHACSFLFFFTICHYDELYSNICIAVMFISMLICRELNCSNLSLLLRY